MLTLSILLSHAATATAPSSMLGRVHQYTVVGVCLDMLLQILWALERLATEITLVRLEWHMDTDMGSDVVALDGGRSACAPLAGEVEVVGTFAPDMAFADVVLGGRVLLVAASSSSSWSLSHASRRIGALT